MDKILHGVLQGSIPGSVIGGTSIISRDMGFAIEFDGVSGYVDYGFYAGECFHSPDACIEGVTFSMWIWSEPHTTRRVIPLDSGASATGRAGYCINFRKRDEFDLLIKFVGSNGKYKYRVSGWNYDRWEHIAWTWNQTQGIRFFLNGCDTDPGATKEISEYTALSRMQPSDQVPFVLGAQARGFGKNAKVKLDDVNVWFQVLTDHEIWMAYVNGGMKWWLH